MIIIIINNFILSVLLYYIILYNMGDTGVWEKHFGMFILLFLF